jgi:hypothetical protein
VQTLGARLGCGATFAIAFVLLSPILWAVAWTGAHCDPVPACRRAIGLRFLLDASAILIAAAFVGLSLRSIVNRLAARRLDGGTSPLFVGGVVVLALAVVGAAIWSGFAMMDRLSR